MKHFRILAILLAVIAPLMAFAEKKFYIKAEAKEAFTDQAKTGVIKAWLMPLDGNDSIFAKSSFSMNLNANGDGTKVRTLTFEVPAVPATYILTAETPGCEEVNRTVTIEKIGSREFEMKIPDLVFYKKATELGEVTVTASKVKFYLNGDTLVYNADAFKLPEGSMLDGLVKQLPGVEIKDGGQIYVNGKFVESLLLNGKDFFKGDNNIMLNNLGAYTVKDVAVYDKWGDKSMVAGQDVGDSQFVMDVRLKRDYMSGFIGNLEAGAGTSSRYLGRLFGMWYTVKSRVTVIGNINNLNDSRRPGQNDNFKPASAPGDFRTKMVGIDYNVFDKKWDFLGNASVNHTRNFSTSAVNRTNFLTAGNTFDNRFSQSLSHNLEVKTSNRFKYTPAGKYFAASHSLTYLNNDNSSSALSGAFTEEITDMNRQILNSIYSGELTSFSDITVNTALTQSLMSGHHLSTGGNLSFESKLAHSPDMLSLHIGGNYTRDRYHNFDRYDINYLQEGTRSTTSSYTKNYPDHSWKVSVDPSYTFLPNKNTSLIIQPSYSHSAATKDSYFYRLDRLGDAGIFGNLPAGYETTLDGGQSYFSTTKSDNANLALNFIGSYDLPNGNKISTQVYPIASYRWRTMDYRQPEYFQRVSHNSFNLEFVNTYISYIWANSDHVKLLFNRTCTPVSLIRLVNVNDNRDPLNLFVGSSSLKNAFDNRIELSWMKRNMGKHRWSNYLVGRLNIVENALVNGYSYNPLTGVRTYSVHNVSGNWSAGLSDYYTKAFGKKDQFDFSSSTGFTYANSADMSSSGGEALRKFTVRNINLSESVRLNWRFGKQQIGVNASVVWRDTRSDNSDFSPFSATNVNYGVSGQFQLPYNFGLSTDLSMYTRRGYAYSELNTTDIVWNARLSYTANKGKWVFMLDGFDLLHQLSNVTYNVNAQGRTETYTNVLPRYGLLHVQYRFAVQPKKKN